MKWLFGLIIGAVVLFPSALHAAGSGFIVYGVQNSLYMGNLNEARYKDLYINMGTRNGLRAGSVVDVYRTLPTYDLINKKLLKEMTFKIAKAKIIHVEDEVAIARVTKLNNPEETPVAVPFNVMVGDPVKLGQ